MNGRWKRRVESDRLGILESKNLGCGRIVFVGGRLCVHVDFTTDTKYERDGIRWTGLARPMNIWTTMGAELGETHTAGSWRNGTGSKPPTHPRTKASVSLTLPIHPRREALLITMKEKKHGDGGTEPETREEDGEHYPLYRSQLTRRYRRRNPHDHPRACTRPRLILDPRRVPPAYHRLTKTTTHTHTNMHLGEGRRKRGWEPALAALQSLSNCDIFVAHTTTTPLSILLFLYLIFTLFFFFLL